MPIIYRNFTYRGKIKLTSSDLDLAVEGRKTCTIRLGKLSVSQRSILLTDGHREIPVEITQVDDLRLYEQLTDEDAIRDGLESKAHLDEDLKRFYGKIDPKQPMTVIHFCLSEVGRGQTP